MKKIVIFPFIFTSSAFVLGTFCRLPTCTVRLVMRWLQQPHVPHTSLHNSIQKQEWAFLLLLTLWSWRKTLPRPSHLCCPLDHIDHTWEPGAAKGTELMGWAAPSGSQCAPGLAESTSLGNMLEMRVLGLHPALGYGRMEGSSLPQGLRAFPHTLDLEAIRPEHRGDYRSACLSGASLCGSQPLGDRASQVWGHKGPEHLMIKESGAGMCSFFFCQVKILKNIANYCNFM